MSSEFYEWKWNEDQVYDIQKLKEIELSQRNTMAAYILKVSYLKLDVWAPCTHQGPIYSHGLTLMPAWIANYILYRTWDEITFPILNFNGCTIEVWEWISNLISYTNS